MRTTREVMINQVHELERENHRLKARLDSLQGRARDLDENLEVSDIAQRYEDVFTGLTIPRAIAPLPDESPRGYRLRLLDTVLPLSKKWRDTSLKGLAAMDSASLDLVEAQVISDAQAVVDDPQQGDFRDPTKLRMVETIEDGGRKVREFRGDPMVWIEQFSMPAQVVVGFQPPNSGRALNSGIVNLVGDRR